MNFWSAPKHLVIAGALITLVILLAPLLSLTRTDPDLSAADALFYLYSVLSGVLFGMGAGMWIAVLVMIGRSFLMGRRVLPRRSLQALSYALTRRWTLQTPMFGLVGPSLVMSAFFTEDVRLRRRYLVALCAPQIALIMVGVAGAGSALLRTIDEPVDAMIWGGAVALIMLGLPELLPIRTSSYVTLGHVVRWLRREPDQFVPFLDRNVMVSIEYVAGLRPRDFSQQLLSGLRDDLDPSMPVESQLLAARLLYLAAIDRGDVHAAVGYIRHVQGMISDTDLHQNNRNAAALLIAFHAAWVDRSPLVARAWLAEAGSSKTMRATPMYLIIDALIAWQLGDVRTAGDQLARADKRLRSFKHVSGTTAFWLELIASGSAMLPPNMHRNIGRREVTLIPIPPQPQSTTEPAAA